MTKVHLNAVRKQFDAFVEVENIDLDIEPGELVALLVRTGCGKTTTLRMIAGLDRPIGGAIPFDRKDLSEQPVQDPNVGMVFQRYALHSHLTVEKKVAFGLSEPGTPRAGIGVRLEEILGASRWQVLRRVTLPMLMHSLVARTLFPFLVSTNIFLLTFFWGRARSSPYRRCSSRRSQAACWMPRLSASH